MRGAFAIVSVCVGVLAACSGDDDVPMMAGDGGLDGASVDAPRRDAPLARAFGAQCDDVNDCVSRVCVDFSAAVGTGYCSKVCSTAADCSGDPEPGYSYDCLPTGSSLQCVRVCRDGFGCPDTDVCLRARFDVCVDVSLDRCARDSDCTPPESCVLATDREHVQQICLAPLAGDGTLRELQGPGEPCDPTATDYRPCIAAGDCPAGWSCDARNLCRAPDSALCALACLVPGVCSALCASDADCPATMRCSLESLSVFLQGTDTWDDDLRADLGLCTYAAGSGAPCVREADCATTGAGGAAESCLVGADASGAASGICVTRVAGYGVLGDACGDDLATEGIELDRICLSGQCTSRTCGAACVTREDCPTDVGWECRPFFGRDASMSIASCVLVQSCARNADCVTPGEVCVPIVDAAGAGGDCEPSAGDLPSGATCSMAPAAFLSRPERCATGRCIDIGGGGDASRCLTLCTTDGDCASDELCGQSAVVLDNRGTLDRADDVTAPERSCVFAGGSRAPCVTSADCVSTETCSPLSDVTGTLRRMCVTATIAGAGVGDSCTPYRPCTSRMCIESWTDPDAGFCSALCASDADCGAAGLSCRTWQPPGAGWRVAACLPADDPRGTPRL